LFKKSKDRINYDLLLDVIIKIDMFRDMKVTNPQALERMLIKTGVKGLREELRILRREASRISSAVSSNKKFIRYVRMALILKMAAVTAVLLIIALVILTLITGNPIFASIALWYPILLVAIVIIPNAYLIVDYYARTELQIMKERKARGLIRSYEKLRELNQGLINKLIENALIDKKHPKKLRFKLWHLDYEGIRIVRRPWLLGKYWVVEPDIPIPEEERK